LSPEMGRVGGSRRFPVAGRPQSWVRFGACTGHHRGLRAGHVCRGGTWERGRAICVLAHMPGVGERVPNGPGVGWVRRPGHEPCGETTHEGSTQGIGERATSEEPREGQVAGVASHRTGERGEVRPKRPMGGKATSGRAFQEVRYTRETLRAPIVSPHPSWTVSTGS
jgi:hypothetical protein